MLEWQGCFESKHIGESSMVNCTECAEWQDVPWQARKRALVDCCWFVAIIDDDGTRWCPLTDGGSPFWDESREGSSVIDFVLSVFYSDWIFARSISFPPSFIIFRTTASLRDALIACHLFLFTYINFLQNKKNNPRSGNEDLPWTFEHEIQKEGDQSQKKKKSQQTKIMKIHKNRRNRASGESKERGGGEREERSGVFHFVHCRGTQFRSLLWVLFFRWPTASRRGVYAPRQTVARWRSCTDTLLRSVSDATSGAIYCLTACSSRTRCLFTAVERSTDPFSSFLRLAEGGTITIASDNERARSKFPFSARSYKSSAARSVSIRGFHWQGRFLRMICRRGGVRAASWWWWTVYGPIVTTFLCQGV